MKIQRILFPVDFSPACLATVPFVTAMAHSFDAELCAVHVVEMPVALFALPDASGFDMLGQLDALREVREAQFQQMLAKHFPGAPVKNALLEGDAATEICRYACEQKVDLIMMPTRGQGAVRKFLLGSVTAKVLHDTHVPVWTGAHTLECASGNADRFSRILCAVDTEPRDLPALQWAAAFAKVKNAELQILHAVVGSSKSRNGEEDLPVRDQLFKLAHQGLEALAKSAGVNCEMIVHGGKPDEVIHDAVQDLGADLVVIGRGGNHGALGRLRSHAYGIIRHSPCPVISV